MRGIFVTFEGIEGSGKSTQAELFIRWLKEKGKKVISLREPGSTKLGEKVRDILLFSEPDQISDSAELLLFLAARAQIAEEKIKPALDSGSIVVLDRYSDSTLAYQGYAGVIAVETIREMNAFATAGISPDITFILDIDIEEGLKRSGCKDRIENKGLEFHSKVKAGYHKLAQDNPDRIFIVKVHSDHKDTQSEIQNIFSSKFPFYSRP
jgi:dTMP kinase